MAAAGAFGLFIATFGMVSDSMHLILNVVSYLLMIFTGAEFPLAQLPVLGRWFGSLLPLTHAIAAMEQLWRGAYGAFWHLLLLELHEREVNRINRMVKKAGFRVLKTLDDFVWNPNIELPVGLTQEDMTELTFLNPKENLIFMGAVGTGKTHLATAIALKACQEGREVRFFTAASLANLLNNKGALNGFLGSLKKTELIVIDEVGFVPLHKDAG